MKKLITALAAVSVMSCTPARAGDFWAGIIAGAAISGIIADQQKQKPGWQQQQEQEYEMMGPGRPAPVIVMSPRDYTEYSRPRQDPRTEYLKECQRYGYTLSRCQLMWDGPAIEQEEPVAKKQQFRS
jgi:hypothetical protein